ncbi:MAG: hypothetical protein ABUL62_34885 [Myxococcales bacterium]
MQQRSNRRYDRVAQRMMLSHHQQKYGCEYDQLDDHPAGHQPLFTVG